MVALKTRGDRGESNPFGESAVDMETQGLERVKKGRRPSSTGLYAWVCVSRGVALGGRSVSWKKNPPALPGRLRYGMVFTVKSGGLCRVCFVYAR